MATDGWVCVPHNRKELVFDCLSVPQCQCHSAGATVVSAQCQSEYWSWKRHLTSLSVTWCKTVSGFPRTVCVGIECGLFWAMCSGCWHHRRTSLTYSGSKLACWPLVSGITLIRLQAKLRVAFYDWWAVDQCGIVRAVAIIGTHCELTLESANSNV